MHFIKRSFFSKIFFSFGLASWSSLVWSGSLIHLLPGELPDGLCLIQSKYAKTNNPQLPAGMAVAIKEASESLEHSFSDQDVFTSDAILTLLKKIAEKRALLAKELKTDWAHLYGLLLPTEQSQMPEFCKVVKCDPNVSLHGFYIRDVIGHPNNPDAELVETEDLIPYSEGKRHNFLFDRASQLLSNDQKFITLTQITKETKTGQQAIFIFTVHPSLGQMVAMRHEAYQRFSDLLNRRGDLSEGEKMDEIAKIYFLLMHAQPFYRGTPAIVESLLDAYLRVDLKKKLPLKTIEPFWEVILFDESKGEFKGEDFLKSYSNSQ